MKLEKARQELDKATARRREAPAGEEAAREADEITATINLASAQLAQWDDEAIERQRQGEAQREQLAQEGIDHHEILTESDEAIEQEFLRQAQREQLATEIDDDPGHAAIVIEPTETHAIKPGYQPDLLGQQFVERTSGSGEYVRAGEEATMFADRKSLIKVFSHDNDVCRASLELAKSKGWSEVHLLMDNPPPELQQRLYVEGQMVGVNLAGYTPTAADLELLEKMRAEQQLAPADTQEMTAETAKELRAAEPVRGDKLIDHGPAPYLNNPKNARSYYAELEKPDGSRVTKWGVGIEQAIDSAGATIGQRIHLEKGGTQPVSVVDSATGKIVDVHRNSWQVEVVQPAALEKTNETARQEQVVEAGNPQLKTTEQEQANQERTQQEAQPREKSEESARQEAMRREQERQDQAQKEREQRQAQAREKAVQAERDREQRQAALEARRAERCKGRITERLIINGTKVKRIRTYHHPTPALDEARASTRKAAELKKQLDRERQIRRKERVAQQVAQRKKEYDAGRRLGMHGRKGVTNNRIAAIEREIAAQERAQRDRAQQDALAQGATAIVDTAPRSTGLMDSQAPVKSLSDMTPQEFARNLLSAEERQQEAAKSKTLGQSYDASAGL